MKKRTNKILLITAIIIAVCLVIGLTLTIQISYKLHPEYFEFESSYLEPYNYSEPDSDIWLPEDEDTVEIITTDSLRESENILN